MQFNLKGLANMEYSEDSTWYWIQLYSAGENVTEQWYFYPELSKAVYCWNENDKIVTGNYPEIYKYTKIVDSNEDDIKLIKNLLKTQKNGNLLKTQKNGKNEGSNIELLHIMTITGVNIEDILLKKENIMEFYSFLESLKERKTTTL